VCADRVGGVERRVRSHRIRQRQRRDIREAVPSRHPAGDLPGRQRQLESASNPGDFVRVLTAIPTAVPEPSSYAAMLMGVAMLGTVAYRRSKSL
jgi:hypothetical protein